MTKRMIRSRKAISPILATLLLVVIAVAAIAVTYAWIMTYMSNAANQAGVRLGIENVSMQNGPPKKMVITVRNTGTADAEIDAVYIGTSKTNRELAVDVIYDPSSKLVPKEGGRITITVNYDWVPNAIYHIKISPKIGLPAYFPDTDTV